MPPVRHRRIDVPLAFIGMSFGFLLAPAVNTSDFEVAITVTIATIFGLAAGVAIDFVRQQLG